MVHVHDYFKLERIMIKNVCILLLSIFIWTSLYAQQIQSGSFTRMQLVMNHQTLTTLDNQMLKEGYSLISVAQDPRILKRMPPIYMYNLVFKGFMDGKEAIIKKSLSFQQQSPTEYEIW